MNEKIFASKLELSKLQTGYRQEEILEAKAAMEEAIENLIKQKILTIDKQIYLKLNQLLKKILQFLN